MDCEVAHGTLIPGERHGGSDERRAHLAPQGVCKNGVCVCQPGYRGAYCEIPPACSGILDAAGNCCPTGVVSQNGTCCPAVGGETSKYFPLKT
jgi:hypothetical protein